jgi:MerR family transcriptional regulator, light-induced transcriptional regulator
MKGENAGWKLDIPKEVLAKKALELQFLRAPQLQMQYNTYQKEKALQDMAYHLRFIEAACQSGSPEILANYLIWLKDLLSRLGVPVADLKQSILCVDEAMMKDAPNLQTKEYKKIIAAGLAALEETRPAFQSYLNDSQAHAELARKYLNLLLEGKRHEACDLILFELEKGLSVQEIYLHVFQTVQYEVGYLWHQGIITVAQEHFCTAASQYIIARLYPVIFQHSVQGPKVLAACIGDELHEMGIRMVADFFELSGYDTYYLGANTPVNSIFQTVKESKPVALALSVTIAFHMGELISLIQSVRRDIDCRHVKILVGGYAFNTNRNLWKHVGADGFAPDAEGAVELLAKFNGKRKMES